MVSIFTSELVHEGHNSDLCCRQSEIRNAMATSLPKLEYVAIDHPWAQPRGSSLFASLSSDGKKIRSRRYGDFFIISIASASNKKTTIAKEIASRIRTSLVFHALLFFSEP